jgi:hypothetical protein
MNKNEVDLNDPLHWFIADSIDDYDRKPSVADSGKSVPKEMLREMSHILADAISCLQSHGYDAEARTLKNRVKGLADRF